MIRSLLLLGVSTAGIAAIGLVSLTVSRSDARACRPTEGKPISGTARELEVGSGITSAWLTYPPRAGEATTVLWRIEGEPVSSFAIRGRNAEGSRLRVSYGPSPVLPLLGGAGLGWERGGREWGSRLVFAAAGCWRLQLDAGTSRGELDVRVRVALPSGRRLRG